MHIHINVTWCCRALVSVEWWNKWYQYVELNPVVNKYSAQCQNTEYLNSQDCLGHCHLPDPCRTPGDRTPKQCALEAVICRPFNFFFLDDVQISWHSLCFSLLIVFSFVCHFFLKKRFTGFQVQGFGPRMVRSAATPGPPPGPIDNVCRTSDAV